MTGKKMTMRLTEEEEAVLKVIVFATDKTYADLIREAILLLVAEYEGSDAFHRQLEEAGGLLGRVSRG